MRIDHGHVRVCAVRVSRFETWLGGAMLLLASCSSSEPFVCPTEGFDARDGDACESEGVVCEIDGYGECLETGTSLFARASCIKGRWDVDTFGGCPDRPRGGAGGRGGNPAAGGRRGGGDGGRLGTDLDAGDEEDASP